MTEYLPQRAMVGPHLTFLPDPHIGRPLDTWWNLTPDLVVRMLCILGFGDVEVTYHSALYEGAATSLYTVVGHKRENPPHAALHLVARLWQEVRGSYPGKQKLDYWVGSLSAGRASAAEFAHEALFAAPSPTVPERTNDQFLSVLYRGLLGRAPDRQGLDQWLRRLDAGADRRKILDEFLSSAEFQEACRAIGIRPHV